MSMRSVTSMRMPQLGGMSQHWRISTLTLQLRPARSPNSCSSWPLASQTRTRSQLSLNFRKQFPRALVFRQLCRRASTSWGTRALPKIFVSHRDCLESSCVTCFSIASSSPARGLLGLEANGHALGVGVVVGRGLPEDLLHFGGLPHHRLAAALAAQGQALAALGVGQKLPELDRHGWQVSLV